MYKSILVTGSSGFVGRRLLPALKAAFPKAKIHGSDSKADAQSAFDITKPESIDDLLTQTQPDAVINLAAISHIPTSFDNPDLTWRVNLQGTLNLLKALQDRAVPCVFLQVGSSDCYGDSFKSGDAVTEETAFMPMNPYAASKAAADLAVYSMRKHPQVKVIRARPFNHTGAGQSNQFVVSAFAEQIAKIEAGIQPPVMKVGNLDAQRCFMHLNDVINAYVALLKSSPEIDSGMAFNIVGDEAISIQQLLHTLLAQSQVEIQIEQDPARMRPTDVPLAQGDASLLKKTTGWRSSTSLETTLSDVLNFWRQHHSQEH